MRRKCLVFITVYCACISLQRSVSHDLQSTSAYVTISLAYIVITRLRPGSFMLSAPKLSASLRDDTDKFTFILFISRHNLIYHVTTLPNQMTNRPRPQAAIKNCNSKFKIEKVAKFECRMSVLSNVRRLSLSRAGRRRAWAGGMQMPRDSVVRGCQCECLVPLAALERPTSPPVTVVFRSGSN